MDPSYRDDKIQKQMIDRLYHVCDSDYGIPTECPCGAKIIAEISEDADAAEDKMPGKRFFTCAKFKNDGYHRRKNWIVGVEEEIEKINARLERQGSKIGTMSALECYITKMRKELKNNAEEIEKLKEIVSRLVGSEEAGADDEED